MKSKVLIFSVLFAFVSMLNIANAQNKKSNKVMSKKILFVVTSHNKKGSTNEPTGYYLGEVSHPWEVLHSAGYDIDFGSPKGGKAPVDGRNLEDGVNKECWGNKEYRTKIDNTMTPADIDPS